MCYDWGVIHMKEPTAQTVKNIKNDDGFVKRGSERKKKHANYFLSHSDITTVGENCVNLLRHFIL